jgi:transposase
MALAHATPRHLLGDKAYDTNPIREDLAQRAIRPVIPPRSTRTAQIRWNRRIYKERNRIERMIGHLKVSRAVATRYDKLASSFLSTLHIAAIRRCLRHGSL